MTPNQLGIILLTTQSIDYAPDQVAEVLAHLRFVPLRVERDPAREVFECEGLSPYFAELGLNEPARDYRLLINIDSTGGIERVDVAPLGPRNVSPFGDNALTVRKILEELENEEAKK